MENILRDKNENVSSGQLVVVSKNEMSSPENLKENHNPKSLLEIATDTTSRFHLDASTPKIAKKSGSYKDISFHLKANDSLSNSSSLSFLANGLNNLNLKGADASDDDEQFLSFNDLSNQENNQTHTINGVNDVTLLIENDGSLARNIENNHTQDFSVPEKSIEEYVVPENIDRNVVSEKQLVENAENKVQENPVLEEQIMEGATSEDITTCVNDEKNVEAPEMQLEKSSDTVTQNESYSMVKDHTYDMLGEEENAARADCPQNVVLVDKPEFPNTSPNLNATNTIETSSNSISGNLTQILNEKEQSDENVTDLHFDQKEDIATGNTNLNKSNEVGYSPQNVVPAENPVLNTTLEEHSPKLYEQQETISFDGSNMNEMSVEKLPTFEEPKVSPSTTIHEKEPTDFTNFSNIDDLRSIFGRASLEAQNTTSPVEVTQRLNNTFDANKNFMECIQPSLDIEFKMPTAPISRKSFDKNENNVKDEFTSAISYNFGESDFDFLQKLGSNSSDQNIGRDSVLLKFDPLLEKPVPVVQLAAKIPELIEEEEHSITEREENCQLEVIKEATIQSHNTSAPLIDELTQLISVDKDNMSVEIMKDIVPENEKQISNLDCEDTKLSSIDHHENQNNNKLMELENKMRMEAEQREEVLLKRISEKDKQISKMNNVVKEYEKAIAELIAEKEQLVQSYEKKCADLKNDSEINAQHLASLEATFSDLHAKYERTKQIASDLKEKEELITQDRKTSMENLKMQEARYEKMKMHAMSQLEIANNKLAEMLRNHQAEVTKLKAQLKKEEISRASINEQLIQKSKENAELVKICDELIGNHGNSHAV